MRYALFAFLLARMASGAALEAWPEYRRPDPFGGVVEPDRRAAAAPLSLAGARGGWISCHLVVKTTGPYSLNLQMAKGVEPSLYREWFHFTESDKRYYPDALVPVATPYRAQIPDPDNKVPGQTAQAFWLDVWVPRDARPGVYKGSATLEAAGARTVLPLEVKVVAAVIPEEDAVTIDHNSYGLLGPPERTHAWYRLFYEHRGTFHNLGYGHAGKVGPEFAPALEGSGRNKHIASWELYDRHYGPLLDGSAFAGTRRGPRPIPYVYLPINPEWPASFLWWGEPGYEAEFANVVSEMERHFREKKWFSTRFELFFNHKKRYKGFPWDGDETRFPNDLPFFTEYARLMKKAVPADTPVKFVYRTDASWLMERQFKEQAGIINFWVCGGLSWYRDAVRDVKQRGDIVWFYSSAPAVTESSSTITINPMKAWMWGVDGYVHWLVTSAGSDPWYRFDGGATALGYPGDRFGVKDVLSSVRLKLQRNAVQEISLLDSLKARRPLESLKAEAARRYNGSTPGQWWTPRPPQADRPAWELTNADFAEAPDPNAHFFKSLDPDAWQRVREYVLAAATEVQP